MKVTAYLEDLFVHGHDEAEEEEVHLVGGEAFHFLVAGAATTAGPSVVKMSVCRGKGDENRHGCLWERELNPVRERELKIVTGVSGKGVENRQWCLREKELKTVMGVSGKRS